MATPPILGDERYGEPTAAALYAFPVAGQKPVVCLAHLTNQMAGAESDFEKGPGGGSRDALEVIGVVARAWQGLRAG